MKDMLQDMEMRISGLEDKVEKRTSAIRESVKSKKKKKSDTRHEGNLGHCKMTKSTNNRDRGRRKRNLDQKHKKYF